MAQKSQKTTYFTPLVCQKILRFSQKHNVRSAFEGDFSNWSNYTLRRLSDFDDTNSLLNNNYRIMHHHLKYGIVIWDE